MKLNNYKGTHSLAWGLKVQNAKDLFELIAKLDHSFLNMREDSIL
ncbi:hypothetical protein DSUL_100055 [Desulfovibrionales bacterium]